MKRDDFVYLQHILDAVSRIEQYTKGISLVEFKKNLLVQDAVIRQIEIIGEASKQVSQELKGMHLRVRWKEIAGMHDKLIHDYLGVDKDAVWDTVEKDLPKLKGQIKTILASFPRK